MPRNILAVQTLAPIWKPDAFIEFITKNPFMNPPSCKSTLSIMSTHLTIMMDKWLLAGWQVDLVLSNSVVKDTWGRQVIRNRTTFIIIWSLIFSPGGWLISPWNGKPKLPRLVTGWDHKHNPDIYSCSKFQENWDQLVSTSDDVVSTDIIGPNLDQLHWKPILLVIGLMLPVAQVFLVCSH